MRKVEVVSLNCSNEELKLGLSAKGVAETKEAIPVKLHVGVEYKDAPRIEIVTVEGEAEECGSVFGREVDHPLDDLQWERELRRGGRILQDRRK